MKRLASVIIPLLFAVMIFGQSAPPQGSDGFQAGVVIEKVTKDLAAEKAGLQPGDVLLHWSRSEAKGDLESPFDLSMIETEQSPQNNVELDGLRGTETHVWTLGPGDWGIEARPSLSNSQLSTYQESESLIRTGRASEAAGQLQAAALQSQTDSRGWLTTWFYLRTAELLAEAQQWNESSIAYQEALNHLPRESVFLAAFVLQSRAAACQRQNDWPNAEKYYQQAIALLEPLSGAKLTLAATSNDLGSVFRLSGDLTAAEEHFHRALNIRERLAPESLAVATTLNGLARTAWQRGDLATAREYCLRALAIRQKLTPDSLDVGTTLTSLGVVAWKSGDLDQAEDYYRRALAILEKLAPDSPSLAATFNNLGILARDRGDLVHSEDYQRRALAIQQKKTPDTLEVAAMFLNLGNLARDRGDLKQAQDYYQQALVIQQKRVPNGVEAAMSLNNLGIICLDRGKLVQAERYLRRGMAIREKLATGSLEVAASLVNLGSVAAKAGHRTQARRYHLQALALERKLAPFSLMIAGTLSDLGELARDSGALPQAESYFRQAIAILAKLAPESLSHADYLAALARLLRRRGETDEAARLFAKAIQALENQTAHLGGTEEIRADYRAKHAAYYHEYIELLLAQKQPELAFQVVERSRARTLLEMLAEGRVDIRRGVDAGLLEQERSLRRALAAKSDERVQLLSGNHNKEQGTALDQEIDRLLAQYNQVEAQIRTSSPSYASLTQPQPVSAKQIQQELLDADTLLLEYDLGAHHSHLWAVSPDSVTSYELPRRATIEALARRVYNLVTIRNRKGKVQSETQRRAAWRRAEAMYSPAAAALSRVILGPVAGQLKAKRLVIVSDGALQYIPFAALPIPSTHSTRTPLITEHEIVNLPSASTLAVLRNRPAGSSLAPKSVAVLADPVFDANDDRMRSARTSGPEQEEPGATRVGGLQRSIGEVDISGDGSFPRLPFTRREAEAIYSIASPGTAIRALDFDASKTLALSPQLKDYRIIHFATHGLLDNRHPELSGLVFSLVDRQGKPQDGFLRLLDTYNLDLNADLVVLSACRTALGKEIRQEGLVGLTRGFMHAGASRVVASLWNVDDEATAELMRKFYEAVLRSGHTPAQALREAQLWVYSQAMWKSPYYWAGFVLQGEWR